jgi:hypothetical protein
MTEDEKTISGSVWFCGAANSGRSRLLAREHAGGTLQWIGNSLRRLDWK